MAVELRLALENRLRIDLPLVSLAEGTSVASIAGAARRRAVGAARKGRRSWHRRSLRGSRGCAGEMAATRDERTPDSSCAAE